MKFSKKYEQYMQGTKHELPAINIKKMKKTMKRCRRGCRSGDNSLQMEEAGTTAVLHDNGVGHSCPDLQMEEAGTTAVLHDNGVGHSCPDHCAVCDETLFPSLLKEMSTIVGCFNQRAKKLLELHLATGLRKYVLWVKGKTRNHHHSALIQEVNELVMYAIINSIAMKKILKKYDKIHHSKQGQAFRTWTQVMHIEILHSPWLCELMAFHINNKQDESLSGNVPGLFEGCSLTFEGGKPSLSCGLFDSLKLNVDLTCSICLDTVFDPIALTCGHIFCYICACGAASVSIIDGLRSAEAKAKCPLCRQAGVFESYVRLAELNILLRNNCHEYWEQRLCSERQDRVRQAKEYWESQCRAFMGM